MKSIALAFRYLWSRPLQAVLNLLLLTLGLASITFVLLVSDQVERTFRRDITGIDLVVGGKGSPMQLVLAGVFNIDVPPGGVPLSQAQALRGHPLVARLVPLTLADNFRGFRIIGTTADYLAHYRLRIAQGKAWVLPMEAVVGAQVAQSAGLVLGDTFFGSHGIAAGGAEHAGAGNMYRVKGILAPCDCVADRVILTATDSVWQVHEAREKTPPPVFVTPAAPAASAASSTAPAASAPAPAPVAEPLPQREPEREISMALIVYKDASAAATLPRFVNGSTSMQAAAPQVEVSHMLQLLGIGIEVLQGVAAVLLFTAALSVFIALWNAVRERREDLAMLRMLGATSAKVAVLLLVEALWLALMASILGVAAGHALTALAGHVLESRHSLAVSGLVWVPAEAWIPLAALAVAALAALVPSVTAYRIDVAQLLNGRR